MTVAESIQKAGKPPGKTRAAPPVARVPPPARPAQPRDRHRGLLLSFVLFVVAPLALCAWYLLTRAEDQFISEAGFTVRSEETSSATEMFSGFSAFMGNPGTDNASILYEFIRSPDIAARIDTSLNLKAHFSAAWPRDPVFALPPDATAEDLRDHWQRILRISYDESSGLIRFSVHAYSADMAQTMAQEVLRQGQILINELNATARADALHHAKQDLAQALERLKTAREEMIRFRSRTQLVDPESDLQGRMGVLNGLQEQLAQALIDYDLLLQSTQASDPRAEIAQRKIAVIRQRIAQERREFAEGETQDATNYPALLGEYERLEVNRLFAEESYHAALAALDIARAGAARQSLYLATFIRPTRPETSEYPDRPLFIALTALILLMLWAIGALIFYSVRDRR
ncbi:MAG: sugar transporter [Rhodobacterales bacterium]|nr:MAG: sugar transporter [Rhodobacterales bacterium]